MLCAAICNQRMLWFTLHNFPSDLVKRQLWLHTFCYRKWNSSPICKQFTLCNCGATSIPNSALGNRFTSPNKRWTPWGALGTLFMRLTTDCIIIMHITKTCLIIMHKQALLPPHNHSKNIADLQFSSTINQEILLQQTFVHKIFSTGFWCQKLNHYDKLLLIVWRDFDWQFPSWIWKAIDSFKYCNSIEISQLLLWFSASTCAHTWQEVINYCSYKLS